VVALIKALGRVGERNVAEIGRVVIDYFQARDAQDRSRVMTLSRGCATI